MAHYQRLSLMEREELSRMLATGASLRAAAQGMPRAPSTLSRELTRQRTLAVHARLRTAVWHLLAHRLR